jgi:hypothetical protein
MQSLARRRSGSSFRGTGAFNLTQVMGGVFKGTHTFETGSPCHPESRRAA